MGGPRPRPTRPMPKHGPGCFPWSEAINHNRLSVAEIIIIWVGKGKGFNGPITE